MNLARAYQKAGETTLAQKEIATFNELEKKKAEQLSNEYKKLLVEEYFQSKRERMSGGHGRMTPLGMTKVFMDELNVADIDTPGLTVTDATVSLKPATTVKKLAVPLT